MLQQHKKGFATPLKAESLSRVRTTLIAQSATAGLRQAQRRLVSSLLLCLILLKR